MKETEIVTQPVNGSAVEPFQKRWFCVALYPSGETFKQDAESPSAFSDVIRQSNVAWVDYIADDPDKAMAETEGQFGFSRILVAPPANSSHLNYQDFDTELYIKLPCIQVREVKVTAYPLIMLIKKNLILTIHTSLVDKRFIRLRRYADTILKKMALDLPAGDKLTILMSRIIDTNNDSNFRHLRIIEELADDLNEDLMNPLTDRNLLGPKIYEMKHALITYMNALWESEDLLHTLRYGDAELMSDDEGLLNTINIMIDEVKRQIGLAEYMSDVLASGLEVIQTIYNNQLQQLNNRLAMVMTYLTIVGTAVLVPNTLATILGNSVFNIGPSDLWWYIILMVGTTIVATALVWWWLRRKGWLPGKPD